MPTKLSEIAKAPAPFTGSGRPLITVFGSTGRVGRATVMGLVAAGARVRAVTRQPERNRSRQIGIETVTADLRNAEAIADAVVGSDAVQVLCPIIPRLADLTARATLIIDALVEGLSIAAPPAVLTISDYGVEVPFGTGVTLILRQLETALQALPSQLTFLRSAEHMHNWQRQLPATLTTGALASMHQPLTKAFPTVHAADVGTIAADLLLEPRPAVPSRRIVYVEGPCRYTALDVATVISHIYGREITARELPRDHWEPALTAGGASVESARLVAEIFDAHNAGRIEAVPGVELRRGTTTLGESLTQEMRTATASETSRPPQHRQQDER